MGFSALSMFSSSPSSSSSSSSLSPMLLFIVLTSLLAGSSVQGLKTSNAPVKSGLPAVVKDLEAAGVSEISPTCFLTSSGTTRAQRSEILSTIFGSSDDGEATVVGSESGLVMANPKPSAAEEVASAVDACGTVLFVPSPMDLSRSEGLFETLAPAMERLLANGGKATLVVASVEPDITKTVLEKAAVPALASLVRKGAASSSRTLSLSDVFSGVKYVPLNGSLAQVLGDQMKANAAIVASTAGAPASSGTPPKLEKKELAAARRLGPKAREAQEAAIATVEEIVSESTLVSAFGELCDAAVKRAKDQLGSVGLTSPLAQKIRSQLEEDLYAELSETFDRQLDVLKLASFEAFKKQLSQLRITPTLADDMNNVAKESMTAFAKASQKLVAKGSKWSSTATKASFNRDVKAFCAERLLLAKASGQFRPIPRKGVTVGFHWLLPKPFGNDFRQEPWMVHALENMVYVPPDKVTDVSPDEIEAGDWRSKVIPNPSAREMVYTN